MLLGKLTPKLARYLFVCHGNYCSCCAITQLCRLGLGAKVSRQSKFVPSDDPVERKLYAKLNAEKRKAANIAKSLLPHLQEML